MTSLRTATLAIIASLFSYSVSAQVVTVGPPGSGAQFEKIYQAVAAVPPGGTVLVSPGNYIEFGIANITKPMTLLGAGSATTSWTLLNLFGAQPVIAVGNLNPGEQVAVVGFTVSSMAGSDAVAAGVSVQDCAGPVLFSDVVASGYLAASWSQVTRGVARVENSTSVTFEHCSFLATSNEPDFATAGLAVTNSLVHVTDCAIAGNRGHAFFSGSIDDGEPGIAAVGSIVRLAGSVVEGGDGVANSPPGSVSTAMNGAAAVDARMSSQILVRGGGHNMMQGGAGTSNGGAPASYGAGGPAFRLDATSLLSTTPDVVMAAGLDGDHQLTTASVSGSGLHAVLPFQLPVVVTEPSLVMPGNAVALSVEGEPSAVCLSLLSLEQVPAFAVPGILGRFTLNASLVVPLPTVTLDGLGSGILGVAVPANAGLVGTVAHSQTVSFAPSGWVAVSSPTFFAVR